MANIVKLPQMGISEESAILAQWYKREGDAVAKGDALFCVETGKTSFDVAAEVEGTLLAVFAEEGGEYPIETPVCAIGEPGEAFEAAPASVKGESEERITPQNALQRDVCPAPVQNGGVFISPRARSLAGRTEVDYTLATATGPEGRIIERDVARLIAQEQKPAEKPEEVATEQAVYRDVNMTAIRRAIANNMTRSLADIPQLTLNASFDATAIVNVRKSLKQSDRPEIAGITLGDMILYVVARMLPEFPDLNAHCLMQAHAVRRFCDVNLGVAVDAPKGLMVPTVFGANRMTLCQLSQEVKRLAAGCRRGDLDPALLTDGTFTVSNMGAVGIESFTPVINPPQTGLMGVCAMVNRPRETVHGIALYPAIGLSLTFDHRAVDGMPAGRFLQAVCKRLENFYTVLIDCGG